MLRPAEHAAKVDLARVQTGPALQPWVENYWSVRWDLAPGDRYFSEVIPHPTVHISFESGNTEHYGYAMPAALVHGPPVRRFAVELTGQGRVFGVKFRPGGFGAFIRTDVGAWRGRVEPVDAALGPAATALLPRLLAEDADAARASIVEDFLQQRLPAPDANYERVLSIVAGMIGDPGLTTVEAVTDRFGIAERTLQRLFRRYVGVGPKWMLRRYRLHDAVTLIDAGQYADLASLAASLGWYDQGHFTREFTAQVGVPPKIYAAGGRTPQTKDP